MESSTLAASIAVHQKSGQLRHLRAHHSLNFNLLLHRAPLKRRSILNIVLAPLSPSVRELCLLYCHFGLRTLLVLPHGLCALFAITIASRKVLRGPKGGTSATKITRTNTKVVLHGYHTRHLFRLACVFTKRTVDNRTRRSSSSSLCLFSLAKYHTISSFGNVWQTVQRCAIVKAQAPCTLLLRLPSRQYRSKSTLLLCWSSSSLRASANVSVRLFPGFLIDKVDLFQAYVPPLARVFLQLQEVNRCWVGLLSRSTKITTRPRVHPK